MRANFSELQFAYGCTREIEDGLVFGPVGIPYFPSLIEEAGPDGGYDVAFRGAAVAIYIQYKVAEQMVMRTAAQWKMFDSSYFRFGIYPANKSPQHNLLKNLSDQGLLVYYCSSAFIEYADYVNYHQNRSISAHSALSL